MLLPTSSFVLFVDQFLEGNLWKFIFLTLRFGLVMQSLDDRQSRNVMRFLQAIHQRQDISESLRKLKCRTLIIVGEQSPFHHEALHINKEMNRRYNALIEVCVHASESSSSTGIIEHFLSILQCRFPAMWGCAASIGI